MTFQLDFHIFALSQFHILWLSVAHEIDEEKSMKIEC